VSLRYSDINYVPETSHFLIAAFSLIEISTTILLVSYIYNIFEYIINYKSNFEHQIFSILLLF